MGSIVIDAVNHFFYPTPAAPDRNEYVYRPQTPSSFSSVSTPQSKRLHEVLRPYTPSRTPSSLSASQAMSTRGGGAAAHASTPQGSRSSEQYTEQPESPSLGARSLPPIQAPSNHSESSRHGENDGSSNSSSPSTDSVATTDASASGTPHRIKVRDLAHIQSFASHDMHTEGRRRRSSQNVKDTAPQYEISGMPIENIIEMVAGLLTKITNTNDMQHEHLHRQMPPPDSSSPISPQTNSVLAFHGKNVPSITILSYLNRINKYCPTSYEVFLSLLVYFDRMTEKVNAGPMQSLRQANKHASETPAMRPAESTTPPLSGGYEKKDQQPGAVPDAESLNLSHFFVVDSFNIHRLVIAGVTCASKFFSDIFYTNSRYAKVGGLPLPELNHLELQFLLLNDFRLSVPVEELEAYGTMLVEFYAREVLAQQQSEAAPEAAR
ncbi:cyclin-like protein interacting with PHO85 [Taxawa tesnikishii (nom. ined.)]|nr:cyclin-like protein interacting with PHO85 [Dothideales sp. JES 119]